METHLNLKRPHEDIQEEGLARKGTHRGKRSKKARNERLQRYIDSGGPERARNTINRLTGMNYISP
jgi:hypothetical protein